MVSDRWRSCLDEVETFEHLHSWRVLQYNASEIRLSHYEDLCLVMRLVPQGVDRLELTLLRKNGLDEIQRTLRDFFFLRVKTIIEGEEGVYGGPPAVRLVASIVVLAHCSSSHLSSISLQHGHLRVD